MRTHPEVLSSLARKRVAGAAVLALAAPGAGLALAAEPQPADGPQLAVPNVGPQVARAALHTHGAAQRRVTRAARRVARTRGVARIPRAYTAARLKPRSIPALERRERRLRRQLTRLRRQAASVPPQLEAIARCESGGNPRTDTGNGFYGKYQFTLSTWQSVGGSGNPAQAPEAEQDRRAATLYTTAGAGQWPVCGR